MNIVVGCSNVNSHRYAHNCYQNISIKHIP